MDGNRAWPNRPLDPMRRRRPSGLPDPRPTSPAQLAIAGVVAWLIGVLIPVLSLLALIGIAMLVVAGVTYFIRPRSREMYWRGRRIDVAGAPTWGERLYRLIYKR